MIKTFILNSDSHVSIDLKRGAEGKMILSVSVDETKKKKEPSESKRNLVYYLDKTVKVGLMDENYKWNGNVTQAQIAMWVEILGEKVDLFNRWAWAESMWGIKYLRQSRYRSIELFGKVLGEEIILSCFE